MKNIIVKFLLNMVIFVFFMNHLGFGYGDLELYLDNSGKLFDLLPEYQIIEGETSSLNGEFTSSLIAIFEKDPQTGTMNITYSGDVFNTELVMNSNFQVLEATSYYNFEDLEIMEKMGFNKRVTVLDSAEGEYTIYQYLDEELVDTKTTDLEREAVDVEIAQIFLQAMIIKNVTQFNSHVYIKPAGFKLKAEFELLESKDLKSFMPDMEYPESFDIIANPESPVYVYEITPKGLTGLFTSIKYYAAYEKEYPHHLIAYWGGNKKYNEFIIITH